MSRGIVVAFVGCPCSAGLDLESPLDRQVFQRHGYRDGEIRVRGRAPEGTDSVIAEIRPGSPPGAPAVRRQEIPVRLAGGRFDGGVRAPAGGPYEVEVRASRK